MSAGARRSNRAVPAFTGNNLIHNSNPLPPVSSLPSFSYGSPQTTAPRPLSARDAKVTIADALESADVAAKARLEAAARERKLAEERAAAEAAAAKAKASARQPSVEPVATTSTTASRKRSLRSQSVLSQDEDTFHEGDETSLEIHRIIASARNPLPESSMLKSRSVNAGTKEPRSAMKGSREEALRPSAKTRAKHTTSTRRTIPVTPLPIVGERDATFDEENQGIGLAPRLVSPSPTPQPSNRGDGDGDGDDRDVSAFRDRQGTPPDTIDYAGDVSPDQASVSSPVAAEDASDKKLHSTQSSSRQAISKPWFLLPSAKTSFRTASIGVKKTAAIISIFLKNLFGPLLNYLLLGFFIFGISTLSYSFLQRSSSFSPPILPPSSSEDVIARLMEVEKQLGALSRAYDNDNRPWDYKIDKEQQLASVRSVISAYSSLSTALDKHTRTYKTEQRASMATMSAFNAKMSKLDKSVEDNKGTLKEHKASAQSLRDQLSKVQGHIKSVDADLQRLKKSQELTDRALRTIEATLPKQIAARLDPDTGKIVVAPELLRYLQTVLRKDMQEEVAKLVPSVRGKPTTSGNEEATYNWDGFLKTNAAKMRGYFGQMSEERWKEAIADGVIVSREDMIKVIRDEFDSVRNVADRDHQKLLKQLTVEAEGAARNVVSTAATSISSAALAAVSNYIRHSKGASGSSSNQYADALIQAALHQYSATIRQKPDYALLVRGTLIDPRLTSSTFDPYGNPGVLGKLSTMFRPGPNEPAHVLTESTNLGDCWSFPQSSGQVSILLAEHIYPSDVTIDHVPRGISGDDTSAPKEVEFWVHIDDASVRQQISKAASVAIGDVSDSASSNHYVANGYVRVASFVYDVNSQYPVQTFELPVDLQKLHIPVRSVSFRILSNWGNDEYTSIYRLRVHGNPVSQRNKSGLADNVRHFNEL
ncbi:hypothetical protein TWF694_009970 [Orbilia ellipsospora]|uniref:SUN domain-containing protein n=1 Tax=Orbilia ellipsospora TaxID=2528407 RepID=A0AAV9XCJ2_9PEZI